MKKVLLWFFPVLLVLACTGCAPKGEAIVWQNSFLEQNIRQWLNKPEGDIYPADLNGIEQIKLLGSKMHINSPQSVVLSESPEDEYRSVVTDFSDLRHCKNLHTLDVYYASMLDIQTMAGLQSLSSLSLYYVKEARGIAALGSLPKLRSLALYETGELEPLALAGCTKLEELYVGGNIPNTAFLASQPALQKLTISFCFSGVDYSPLSQLVNLTDLSIFWADFKDVEVLRPLTKLQHLTLRDTNVRSLTALEGLASLQTLSVGADAVLQYQAEQLAKVNPGLSIEYLENDPFESIIRSVVSE